MGACHCRDKLIIYTIIMHMYFCTCSSSKNNYKFAMFTFSVLVNCSSLENLVKVMETCKILFCSKSIDDGVTKSFNRLVKWFGELEDLPLLDNDENEEDLLMEEEDSIEDTLAASNESEKKHVVSTTWKPFGAYFELKLKLVDVSCDSALPANPFYQPKFVTKLQKSWLPTSPFWSSMLRGAIHTCFQ